MILVLLKTVLLLEEVLLRACVRYYEPGANGSEKQFGKFLEELRKKYENNQS